MKKAFLLGCNSGDLRHCASDAALMEAALQMRGYDEIIRYAVDEVSALWCTLTRKADGHYSKKTENIVSSETDILGRLRDLLTSVKQSDTFVFYFAGHGSDEGKDTDLVLYVGRAMNDVDYHLDATDVIKRIRRACKAARNVIILDCCEAGAAVDKISANEEFFRVLTATNREGAVRELDKQELRDLTLSGERTEISRVVQGAGFLTWHLHYALTVMPSDLVDTNSGSLGIEQLTQWLQGKADAYNIKYRTSGKSIEIPKLYGMAVNIALAEKLDAEPYCNYPPELIEELKDLLAAPGLSEKDLTVLSGLVVRRGHLYHPACGGDISGLVEHFKSFEYLHGEKMPLPLLSFAAMVARRINDPTGLEDWLRRCREYLQIHGVASKDIKRSLGEVTEPTQQEEDKQRELPRLMVEAALQAKGYELTCTFQDELGKQEQVAKPRVEANLSEIKDLLHEALQDKKVQGAFRRFSAAERHLELFLPYAALGEDPERWNPKNEPLSVHFRLALRSQERIATVGNEEHGFCRNWKKTWDMITCLDKPPTALCEQADPERYPFCADWITPHGYKEYLRHINTKGNLLFALTSPPAVDHLAEMLEAGVDMLLWPRRQFNEDSKESLCVYLSKKPLVQLPEALRLVHEELWADRHRTGCSETTDFGFALLWDDPDPKRRPRMADQELSNFPLVFGT
jgi:hypothetical protein